MGKRFTTKQIFSGQFVCLISAKLMWLPALLHYKIQHSPFLIACSRTEVLPSLPGAEAEEPVRDKVLQKAQQTSGVALVWCLLQPGWARDQLQILTAGHCFKAVKPEQAEQKFTFWLFTAGTRQPRKDKFWSVPIPLYMSITALLPV